MGREKMANVGTRYDASVSLSRLICSYYWCFVGCLWIEHRFCEGKHDVCQQAVVALSSSGESYVSTLTLIRF